MRTLLPSLVAALTAAAVSWSLVPEPTPQNPVPGQERGQDPDEPKRGAINFNQVRKARIEKLTKEIEGCWILNQVAMPDRFVQKNDVGGFAMFKDGLMASSMRLTEIGGVFGTDRRYLIQAGLHRYRFDEFGQLQMANVQSFTNMNQGLQLVFDPPPGVRQYDPEITNGTLTLRRADGALLLFNRITSGEFPSEAAEALRRYDPKNPLVDDRLPRERR